MTEKQGIYKIEEFKHLGKADLHIHSNYSDAKPSIQEILDYVEEKTDLDVIAITDHDTIEGALEAVNLMKKKKYRFELIIGEEMTSNQGHILGLFLKEKIPAGLTAKETLKRIHKQGGFSIAAHPFQSTRMQDPKMPTLQGIGIITLIKEKKGIDGVEIVNASPNLKSENIEANVINKALLFKTETGSSDAHIVDAIGIGYTLFEGKTVEELRYALEHCQTQAMYGRWTLRALIRLAFFFIPTGFRILIYTILHGRVKNGNR